MIDDHKVKIFWDNRASFYGRVPFESIANLEEESELLELKIKHEIEVIQNFYPSFQGQNVLDLGSGVGQWSLRFADWGAMQVSAVEYSNNLVKIGRREVAQRGLSHKIKFYESSAQNFKTKDKFDLIFISGLFVYLNDIDAQKLCSNLISFCSSNSIVFVRDGTGLERRYEITDKYSERLKSQYSAIYRSREEYLELFGANKFKLKIDSDMFPEGHPLNKYPESRLRVYLFRPE
jgi:cyclopropane fatty-acyl-phospholipid synthase-like methyltransferase